MSRPAAALQTVDLSVGYGPVAVVQRVALQVGKGEAVALLGANGAGKSTLLKGLSGLLKPSAGKVLFGGVETQGLAAEALVTRGMAHVAEGRRIFRRETVLDNLLLGMYRLKLSPGERDSRCEEVFTLFPVLKQKAGLLAGGLSGGQQQMLAIAQALVRKPSLVMLDEPSVGLAPNLVEEVFRTLETVRAQGVAVLLVEQVVERTLEFVDYAYLLQNGRVTATGTPAELAGSDVVQRAYLGEAAPMPKAA
ncbi:ATP-binding cassette domain-containing protein [Ramlibacter sp. G-1-2-2]|uniref:ATP-binding cassette domain-containing protein n=1 Tax=Ramlibacter agri TaxID=2728837 RepID=A0A848HCR1_9BURK|nr:ATP-binding cassette domain-containing protein [Ramlibacter agri]NML47260.1 ATP-binding cassette domain-containing protein [Ramlibacter agri]